MELAEDQRFGHFSYLNTAKAKRAVTIEKNTFDYTFCRCRPIEMLIRT